MGFTKQHKCANEMCSRLASEAIEPQYLGQRNVNLPKTSARFKAQIEV